VEPLTTSVTGHPSYTLIELAGEADVTSSDALDDLLRAEARKRPRLLILDLSLLRFLDSSALQAIIRANRGLRANDGSLVLVNPRDAVARILEMTEVDRIMPVCATVEEAAERGC
jgi:anti-anti-sigma factor